MNEWITSIQPPGLMKMRLMHHQEHHLGHHAPQNKVCHPHNVALPHERPLLLLDYYLLGVCRTSLM